MADDDYKYIYTKRRVYRLPKDARGIPVEEAFPGAEMPAFLKGALVYDTPRGRIIARQESEARDGSVERKDDGSAGPRRPPRMPQRRGNPQANVLNRPRDLQRRCRTIRCGSSERTCGREEMHQKRGRGRAIMTTTNSSANNELAIPSMAISGF